MTKLCDVLNKGGGGSREKIVTVPLNLLWFRMIYCKFGVLMRGQAGERVGGDEKGVVCCPSQ